MSKFINMDFDSSTNKWWVEYIDDNDITQKDEFDTELLAKNKYNELI
jgi:hypothetical protein